LKLKQIARAKILNLYMLEHKRNQFFSDTNGKKAKKNYYLI